MNGFKQIKQIRIKLILQDFVSVLQSILFEKIRFYPFNPHLPCSIKVYNALNASVGSILLATSAG